MIPLQSDLATLAQGVNMLWVLIASFLIFFMKAGFAMLEAGQVRSKNVANQLTQSLFTLCVGVLVFFAVGAGVAELAGALTSGGDPAGAFAYLGAGSAAWVQWLFGAMFAIAAANVVSGGVAGRTRPRMYVVYTAVVAGVIYPIAAGLAWKGGFLATIGFHDFAGGLLIHGMGGISGLVAAWVLGPRIGRFNEDGSANVIPGHSITLAVLGTLILCFGWYGFNVGTATTVFAAEHGALTLDAFSYVGRVALVTTLGMATGGLGAGLVAYYRTGKVDTLYIANGMLAGLVGVTGAADHLTVAGSLLLGALVGGQLPIVFAFVERRLKIDDVCAVFPVHGSAGVLGIVLAPLLAVGGPDVAQVGIQLVGVAVVGTLTISVTYVLFRVAVALGQARVDPDSEKAGLDISEHGVETYPEFGEADPFGNETVPDGGFATSDD